MKFTHYTMLAACLCLALVSSGCSTTNTGGSTPGSTAGSTAPVLTQTDLSNIQLASSIAASATLAMAYKDDADRIAKAKILVDNVAPALESISGGSLPAPSQIQSIVSLAVPDKKHWATLATSIAGSIYASQYYRFKDHPATDTAELICGAIAAGIRSAAEPYLNK